MSNDSQGALVWGDVRLFDVPSNQIFKGAVKVVTSLRHFCNIQVNISQDIENDCWIFYVKW